MQQSIKKWCGEEELQRRHALAWHRFGYQRRHPGLLQLQADDRALPPPFPDLWFISRPVLLEILDACRIACRKGLCVMKSPVAQQSDSDAGLRGI